MGKKLCVCAYRSKWLRRRLWPLDAKLVSYLYLQAKIRATGHCGARNPAGKLGQVLVGAGLLLYTASILGFQYKTKRKCMFKQSNSRKMQDYFSDLPVNYVFKRYGLKNKPHPIFPKTIEGQNAQRCLSGLLHNVMETWWWCAASTALWPIPSPGPPIPLSPLVSSRSTHGIITVSICLTSYSFLKLSTTRG